MNGSLLRWFLAALLAGGLAAGLFLAGRGRFGLKPGGTSSAVWRLTGILRAPPERRAALKLTGSGGTTGRAEPGRPGNLGARLVEGGRPRAALSPLVPLEADNSLRMSASQPVPPGPLKPPAPASAERAATRERAVSAARTLIGDGFAPRRRKIPGRPRSDAGLREVLRAPASVPRLEAPSAEPRGGAEREPSKAGGPVSPPAGDERMPAPVVPLP